MKKVNTTVLEKGDHVKVTAGLYKGRVGTVVENQEIGQNVKFQLVGKDYSNDEDEDDYWDDEDEDSSEYENLPLKYLQILTKAQFDRELNASKIMIVPGLPVSIQFSGASLIIGDNVVTKANAKKIAEFITKHTKGK